MSNQTVDEALDAVLKAAGTALKNYSGSWTLDKMRDAMRKAMSDSYIAGSNACADILQSSRSREAELMAEIERLNKESQHYFNCGVEAGKQIAQLQQQLDSLKQKVSEHNEGLTDHCKNINGCFGKCHNCPQQYMIDIGEHHEQKN